MDRNEIRVIQAELQMENDCFDRLIIALERLEAYLLAERNSTAIPVQTAVGNKRDFHNDTKLCIEKESYFSEVKLQCQTVYMCSYYEDEEISAIAVELFLSDLLEWYSGRLLNEKYDEVDLCIIPIVSSIIRNTDDVCEIYEKYVHVPEQFKGDKEQMMRSALDDIIKGQDYFFDSLNNREDFSDEIIYKHVRGSRFDGYKHLIKALTVLCDTSTPVKSFVHAIKQYLPDVSSQLADVNDEMIDKLFEDNKMNVFSIGTENGHSLKELLPKLKEMIKGILDNEKIKYQDIDIKIK